MEVTWKEAVKRRLIAAWRVLRSDEYVVVTKKHCKAYKSKIAGIELLDNVAHFVRESIIEYEQPSSGKETGNE